jgi:hypothetical protein
MLSIGRKYIASQLREELAKKTPIYHIFFTKQTVIQSTSDLFNGKNNSNIGQLGVISSSMMSPSSFLKSNMDNCNWYDLYSNMTKNKDTTKYIPEFEKYIGRVNDFWIENTDLWNTGKIIFVVFFRNSSKIEKKNHTNHGRFGIRDANEQVIKIMPIIIIDTYFNIDIYEYFFNFFNIINCTIMLKKMNFDVFRIIIDSYRQ